MTSLDPALLPLVLLSPLDGWAGPLSEVPDPVFADKMMGDGLAIDPTGSVLSAPCDGEITVLHRAGHAVTLRAANDAEILMHIGLETVALQGRGFTLHVKEGDRVKAGDKLISFDIDVVARGATSLITPILVTNSENFALERRVEGTKVVGGQALMTLRRLAPQMAVLSSSGREIRRPVTVTLAHGIHARPAARLADLAKSFAAEIAFEAGERRANAKSPIAVMGLGLAKDAEITVIAVGAEAQEAADALVALIADGMGESQTARHTPSPTKAPLTRRGRADAGAIAGVRAAPGMTLGVAVKLTMADIKVDEEGHGAALESQRLQEAMMAVKARLTAGAGAGGARAAILAAHLGFLDDPELAADSARMIAQGKSAGFAWRHAIATQTAILSGLKDPLFVERVADLKDLDRQIQIALGATGETTLDLPVDAILLAEDLLPSQLVGFDASRLAGIATVLGGPTSHVAILAASMNIPALVACGPDLLDVAAGARLLLDADHGILTVDPSASAADKAVAHITEQRKSRVAAQAKAHDLCHTRDGVRIEVAANLGSLDDAKTAVAAGAEGCGLLRTEFLFLDRQTAPDEAEQLEIYRAIALALADRPLIVRTLDIGGDKPAPYLPIPAEENPALGLRGVRVSLWRPDLLSVQLRAILRGVPPKQCRIMVPMIASLAEFRKVRVLFDSVRTDLGITEKVALGVMVETPAAAMTADILASEADFLSIGTNDLTQYTLAMDRGNASVAADIDALHPAVLRLIAATAQGAAKHDRWTGVCGGLASDMKAVPILIGLGVRELSVTKGQIADIKAAVGRVTLAQCQALAERALAAQSAADVRALTLTSGDE